jgi:aminoglycoside 6'-N-acetyltransferase
MKLVGDRIVLRRVTAADLPTLIAILREPAVAARWSAPDDEGDRALLAGEDGDGAERITTWAITLDGAIVGWIAGWEKLEPDYRHAGIDLFVATDHHRKGIGPEAIALVCRHLFEQAGHHRITIDPAADNVAAIRAYEKVGFRAVGVLRRYERGADGTFHDGLLMDLLPEDLELPRSPAGPLRIVPARGSLRWAIGDRVLDGSEIVELCCSGGWLTGRFEWNGTVDARPTFHFSVERGGADVAPHTIPIPEGAILRRAQ